MFSKDSMKHHFFIIAVGLFWSGCSGPTTVTAKYLLTDAERPIEILTEDEYLVTLASGDYAVTRYRDSTIVTGTGTIRRYGEPEGKRFSGSINFNDITYVEISPMPVSEKTIAIAWVAAFVTGFVVLLSQVSFHM